MRDKAGARITTVYPDDVPKVTDLLRDASLFDLRKEDNKIQYLGTDKIGYLGIHFDIVVPTDQYPEDVSEMTGELWCEVQLHTGAQTLFATTSHDLLYKTPQDPPDNVRRAINRLSVVGEIFDSEVCRAREAIVSQTGYPQARIMFELENLFLALTGLAGDAEITRLIVDALLPLYDDVPVEEVCSRLALFASERSADLGWMYERKRDGVPEVMLWQPASLMIFERLEADPFRLVHQWQVAEFPLTWLEALAASYGQPIGV
jgi:hypothetical protein